MLARIAREHAQKQQSATRDAEVKRREAKTAIAEVTDHVHQSLQEHTSTLYTNQKQIEQQSKSLIAQTNELQKNIQQWQDGVEKLSSACKELGDVNNWVQVMENDLRKIVKTLEFVHNGTLESAATQSQEQSTE